ncbi:MAG: hypothetical protein N2053_00975 [Chitinispirillaceae bacterium]|nr:hypothetical protein [Chitinispirillaceae bacterium]
MWKKFFFYISSNGRVLMFIGFIISLISLIVYMKLRFLGSIAPRIAFGSTIAGFVIYLIGRIFVIMENRKSKVDKVEESLKKDTPKEDDDIYIIPPKEL